MDLDGAKAKHIVNWKVLENLATRTNLRIDFGGGIKSDEDLKIAFESGARQITGGSIAVKEPLKFTSWITAYGSDKIILGADAMDGKIAVSGWQEESDQEIGTFIEDYVEKGIQYVISTDISKDGMLEGPSFELYESIQSKLTELKLIASGGVSSMDDLHKLKEQGLEGAIVGKAIYENRVTLKDLSEINA